MLIIKKIFDKFTTKYYVLKNKIRGYDFDEIAPEELGLDKSKIKRNSSSSPFYIKKCFRKIKIRPNDSILDLGSSKGLFLESISNFGFKKIDGIEISQYLAEIAFSNLKKILPETNIFIEDAKFFKSYDNYNFFYLYNSFYPEDLRQVLYEIINQNKNKSEILIIYNNPRKSTYNILKEFKNLFLIANLDGISDHRIIILSTNKRSNRIRN